MAYVILPLVVLAIFIGATAIEKTQVSATLPGYQISHASSDAQEFLRYRSAVAVYQTNNPAFTGSVPSSSLAALGYQFSSAFLSIAGNYISSFGTAGRTITCYANLAPGAIGDALSTTSNDISLGISTGTNWTSSAPGANSTSQPLATSVPNGDVVSVISVGS